MKSHKQRHRKILRTSSSSKEELNPVSGRIGAMLRGFGSVGGGGGSHVTIAAGTSVDWLSVRGFAVWTPAVSKRLKNLNLHSAD